MKKKTLWLFGFTALSLLLGMVAMFFGGIGKMLLGTAVVPAAGDDTAAPVIVIDPGHGGEDGGCSADDGTLEKELNLYIGENVKDILNAAGYPAVMTRSTDTLLYDMYGDLTDYTGKKKVFDLRNRLRFFEDSGAEMLVSIHMNKFPDKKYSGLQVYYSKGNSESVSLADRIQGYTEKYLQTDNDRLTKAATSKIYLLNRANKPAVLVECGFLSNDNECEKLNDPEYRKKLSLCIASAIIDTVSKKADGEDAVQ